MRLSGDGESAFVCLNFVHLTHFRTAGHDFYSLSTHGAVNVYKALTKL